ncbi:hypothetical protein V6N13_014363 [Hibiscus sabdariffa]|uniref:Uncharacterized protein n=1 Tax=Hibiscus sabdariffa TaxID=183260 RepID=A0ABR2RVL4_9ROSI
MAKQTPPPLKRRKATSFSETEMDAARQLMQLCRKHGVDDGIDGDRGSKKAKQADETLSWNRYALKHEEEKEYIQPRQRKFKSMDFIYRITEPLIIQNH